MISMPDKTIIRVHKESNFVIVSRFPLEDSRLTWEARGMYGFLLAKPDNWQISLEHLSKSSPTGYDKAKRILSELVNFKYIRKEERRNQRGQFSYPAYTIYELPYDGYFTAVANPVTVKPKTVETDTETPSMENPSLIKKQVNKDTKKTTTQDYIWPDNIDSNERSSIKGIIANEHPVVVQEILYEIAGQTKFKKSPASLFHYLLNLAKEGKFIPSVADSVKTKNEVKERQDEQYQRLMEDSIRRGNEQLNLNEKKS